MFPLAIEEVNSPTVVYQTAGDAVRDQCDQLIPFFDDQEGDDPAGCTRAGLDAIDCEFSNASDDSVHHILHWTDGRWREVHARHE